MAAFFFKRRMSSMTGVQGVLLTASHFMEMAVGVSLVLIGVMGVKEAREWKEDLDQPSISLGAAASPVSPPANTMGNRAVLFNGLLHGFSWDGAPSLAPAIAVASWRGNISFLLAYAIGTIIAMSATTTLVGEGSSRAGEVLDRPDIPQKLSFASSFVAIAVGVFWVGCGLINR
mmetsp:Transcript_41611/g.97416  ORF Transcript_41611/g.97416 Transcript_41611/m.97416 type:complete len:174 (-) Transcript_41611:204-725(-)